MQTLFRLVCATGLAALCAVSTQAQVYGLKTSTNGTTLGLDTVLFTFTPPMSAPVSGTFNVTTDVPVTLGGTGVVADGLAINGSTDLFAWINSDRNFSPNTATSTAQLVSLNKTTGVATAIGTPLAGAWVTGAAFDMSNRLWAYNYIGNQLHEINPATGAIISSVTIDRTIASAPSSDIAFSIDGNAYITSGSGASNGIYGLNTATGETTPVYTSFPNSLTSNNVSVNFNGMAIYRNGEVWLAQANGIDRIVYSTGLSNFASAVNVVTDLTTDTGIANSGAMDLAARPNRVTADPDATTTTLNASVNIAVLSNDKEFWSALGVNLSVDATGSLAINTWPKTTANGGTVTVGGGGLVYQPATGFTGVDSFTYRAVATDGSWAETTVQVTVLDNVLSAQPDSGSVGPAGGVAVTDIRSNDTINGAAASSANTTVAVLGSWPAGITLSATGGVEVAAGTLPSVYLLNYELCDAADSTNCVTAVITVTVTAAAQPAMPVPVNTAWALMLTGLGLMVFATRRRSARRTY